MNWKVWIAVILIVAAFAGGLYFKGITGNVVQSHETSYTKAICNNGQCVDVYVECTSQGPVVTPLTPYVAVNTSRFNISNSINC